MPHTDITYCTSFQEAYNVFKVIIIDTHYFVLSSFSPQANSTADEENGLCT